MGLVVAYTSAAAGPIAAQVDWIIDLAATPFPVANVQLFGDGTEVGDPGPVLTFAWTILEKPVGSAVRFLDTGTANSTLQDPVLVDVDTWENIVVFLVVTNTNTGNSSEADYYAAPTTARVHVRLLGTNSGLEKLAYLELNWKSPYHELVAAIDSVIAAGVVIPPELLQLVSGGYAGFAPTDPPHKHHGSDIDVATTAALGVVLLSDPPVDPLNPVVLNRETLPMTAQIAGFRDITGIHPWPVGVNIDAAGNPAPLCLFELPSDCELDEFHIHMQDGGAHGNYTTDLYIGTRAQWLAGTQAAITNYTGTPAAANPNDALFLSLAVGAFPTVALTAREYLGLICSAARPGLGGGMTANIPLRRTV